MIPVKFKGSRDIEALPRKFAAQYTGHSDLGPDQAEALDSDPGGRSQGEGDLRAGEGDGLSRGGMGCIKEVTLSFVARMEDVPDVDERPLNPKEQVVCLDEKLVSLNKDIRPPQRSRKAGEDMKRDYE